MPDAAVVRVKSRGELHGAALIVVLFAGVLLFLFLGEAEGRVNGQGVIVFDRVEVVRAEVDGAVVASAAGAGQAVAEGDVVAVIRAPAVTRSVRIARDDFDREARRYLSDVTRSHGIDLLSERYSVLRRKLGEAEGLIMRSPVAGVLVEVAGSSYVRAGEPVAAIVEPHSRALVRGVFPAVARVSLEVGDEVCISPTWGAVGRFCTTISRLYEEEDESPNRLGLVERTAETASGVSFEAEVPDEYAGWGSLAGLHGTAVSVEVQRPAKSLLEHCFDTFGGSPR